MAALFAPLQRMRRTYSWKRNAAMLFLMLAAGALAARLVAEAKVAFDAGDEVSASSALVSLFMLCVLTGMAALVLRLVPRLLRWHRGEAAASAPAAGSAPAVRPADQLVALLDGLGQGVVVIDPDGTVAHMNTVAQTLLRIAFARLPERSMASVFAAIDEEDWRALVDGVLRVFETGQAQTRAARICLYTAGQPVQLLEAIAAPAFAPVEGAAAASAGGSAAGANAASGANGANAAGGAGAASATGPGRAQVVAVVLAVRDAGERRRTLLQPAETRPLTDSMLAGMIEDAAIGLRAIGPDGTILSASRAELDMLGYSHDEYVGQPIEKFHADAGAFAEMMRRLCAGEVLRGYESRMRCKDGSVRQVRIDARICSDGDGPFRVRAFTRDLTAQRAAEARVAALMEELHQSERQKDEFLAMLAHELRNPLAPILSAVQVLEMSDQNSPPALKARGILVRQVRQMVRLIDDLLQVSRLTCQRLELRRGVVRLDQVLEMAVEAVRPLLDQKHHVLSVQHLPVPVWIDGDETRLVQIFANLLDNAARFTEPGGNIRVVCEALPERAGAGPGPVRVAVADTGVGLTAELLSVVFDMFRQADHSIERSSGGLGLGLTLARRLAHLHGGEIVAASPGPGRGSTFTVTLPCLAVAHVAPRSSAEGTASVATAAPDHLRVLVVDDNGDAAEALSTLLQLLGHDVEVRHDGAQAVEASLILQPDVILLDIGLPVLNGYEAARRIREQVGGGDIFLIALTGYGQADDKRRSQEAGFSHHLVKPVAPATLAELLDEARQLRAQRLVPH